jgi:citrate lyase subunit beta/citryl-CoA lyase
MTSPPLRLCRSLLFLPASNPRAIAKARTLEADMIILDLEDAVKAEEKEAARAAAVEAVREGFGARLAAIRVNAAGTIWHEQDVAAVAGSAVHCIVVPKVEAAAQAQKVAAAGKPLVAMIETASGVLAAAAVAQASAALLVGTNDLRADLGIPAAAGREGLALSLQFIVLAARAAGGAVFDGVYNRLEDDAGLAAECREGRAFGFDGKSVIHPSQIATANRVFSPDEEEVAAAERLIAAARGGAERFEGRMIEAMHVAEAEAALAKARR